MVGQSATDLPSVIAMVIIAYRAARPAMGWSAHAIGRVANGIDAILVALPGWIVILLASWKNWTAG